MKKILALVLAMLLAMGMMSALAITEDNKSMKDIDASKMMDATSESNTVTIRKNYTVSGTDAKTPADTLTFTVGTSSVAETTTVAAAPAITIESVNVAVGETSKDIVVKLPAYSEVGIYTYPITENDGGKAGVGYTGNITLVVTVVTTEETDASGNKTYPLKAIAAVHCENGTDAKTDSFANTYDAGSLSVKKTVTGSLGDRTKEFHFTVEFIAPAGDTVGAPIYDADGNVAVAATAWNEGKANASITLKHDQTITFNNIPAGTTYKVTETEADQDNYTTTSTNDSGTITKATTTEVVFTNDKDRDIDTGITLDTLPYLLVLAAVAVGAVLMMARKRRSQED